MGCGTTPGELVIILHVVYGYWLCVVSYVMLYMLGVCIYYVVNYVHF